MEVIDSLRLSVRDTSGVGHARRTASELAQSLGFDATGIGRVALVVTEAATNLVKHAAGGELLLQKLAHGSERGIDVLALDRGPGIADVSRATRDGFSTGQTPGTGLGAILRGSGLSDLYTRPGKGTALFARLWVGSPPPEHSLDVGVVNVCHPDETVSGDAFASAECAGKVSVVVADGLGHGPGAAEAALAAVAVFRADPSAGPAELIARMHGALAPTRGAAVGIAELDRGREVLRFAGVGNIAGTIANDGATRSTVSMHGTVGHDARRIQEYTYPLPKGSLFVLHSDGISARWSFEGLPGLPSRRAALIAGVLYRDFGRERDDATVVVLRESP